LLAAEARCQSLQQEYDLAVQRNAAILAQGAEWQQKAANLSEQLLSAEQELRRGDKEKAAWTETLGDAKRKVAQLEEELAKSKERVEAARKTVDSKLEEERSLRCVSAGFYRATSRLLMQLCGPADSPPNPGSRHLRLRCGGRTTGLTR
jgi:predicted  nucleic acid-binding Zn-ribbon protein